MNTATHLPTAPGLAELALLRVFWYFGFFKHALNLNEVHKYLGLPLAKPNLENLLRKLVESGRLLECEGFYGLNQVHLQNRLNNRLLNLKFMVIAQRYGRLIEAFPFVRSVFISGSLSKFGINHSGHDVDYFLVVAPNRVWTTKFLLMAFKKLFLFNSHKYFCINLLRDENHLKFEKENIYIATEIASLLPLGHNRHQQAILQNNTWVFRFFPNLSMPPAQASSQKRQNILEALLNFTLGNKFENWCRRQFAKHVKRQQNHGSAYFETLPHSSAYFPESMESKILAHYASKFNQK